MSLTVFDCLVLGKSTFLVGDTTEGTVILPLDVESEKDNYTLITDSEWERKTGWAYRWYDSGKSYMTENDWIGMFSSKQKAFDDAFRNYASFEDDGSEASEEEEKAWKRFARVNNLKLKL
jgi:hypothetical protein